MAWSVGELFIDLKGAIELYLSLYPYNPKLKHK